MLFRSVLTITATAYFDTKNVGTHKTITITLWAITGTDAGKYVVDSITSTSTVYANITPKTLTVTATGINKVYDGGTTATVTLANDKVAGDVLTFSYVGNFDTKHVGIGKTVSVTAITITGVADAGNYTLASTTTTTTANITTRAIAVNAITNTKVYDGGTTAAAVPTWDPALVGTDTFAPIETYVTKHVGAANKVLVPSGVVNDGNSGLDYSYTYNNFNTGTITARAIVVTAVDNNKVYDNNLTAAGVPTWAPALVGTDTFAPTETYTTEHFGIGNKILVPAGVVVDGNSGLDYSYTYTNFTAGTITKLPVTVTAVNDNRVYNGGTSSTGVPTWSTLAPGDTFVPAPTQVYSDKHVGLGNKTLIPSGVVNDGNSGLDYSYTYTNYTAGTITARAITLTAVYDSKEYDGTTSSTGVPTWAPALVGTDTFIPAPTQTFSKKNVGMGNKILIPAGVVNDGNSGLNYAYTYTNYTLGSITAKPITVTAVTDTKEYDGTTSSVGVPVITPGLATGDTEGSYPSGIYQTFATPNKGINKTLIPTGVVIDGNGGANYSYTWVNDTTGVIGPYITTLSLPNADLAVPYTQTLNAVFATPFTWSIVEIGRAHV